MATFDVTDVLRRAQATGNGSTTSFAFSFRINNTSDVKVYVDSTLKTESSHYSVQDGSGGAGLAANGTGAVVFGSAPANNAIVTILSDVPLSRAGVYTSGGTITAAALETDFDSLTMALGDREERDARSLMAPVNDTTSVDMTLPAKATRAGKVLGFNASTGNPEAGPSITDVQTLSAVTASIALLGTSDAVSDMNTLATSAIVEDMNLLATSAVIEDMGLLATSAVIEDMGLLATSAVIEDMGLLGTSANVTAMGLLGTSAVIEDMGILSASAVVADMALLATTDVIADMALLADSDVISDMNTLATSDIVSDLNVLATSDIVSDMNALATSDIISDLNALATSDIISDMNALATSDIISDMNTLATSAVIADMASLAGSGANPNITSVTASGTIQFGSLSDGTITITDIADEDNMSSNSAVKLATQQSIKAYVDSVSTLSLIDEDNMASNSATRPPSQQSVKAYVDAVVPLVIIDEDNMASNSATRPPSQQSVKAYVDAIPDVIDEDNMGSDSATRPPSQQSTKAYIDGLTGDASTSAKGRAQFSSDNFAASSGTITIKDQGVLYAEVQNISATDKILGRSSSGAGSIEEITCTAAGRALLDDANATAQVATLGLDTVKKQGLETIYVPATAMFPNTTAGCSDLTQVELANGPELKVLDFDASSDENAQFSICFPKSWNEGTITFQAFFTVTGTNTGTVAWGLSGVSIADNASNNTAFGTNVVATAKAHSGTSNDLNVSAVSGAVTIANAAVDTLTHFQIMRDVSADDQSGDARLQGIKIFFTTDAANDA